MTREHSPWAGMIPVDDTALFVTDSGGPGTDWRHIGYDERARARSRRSADYSFEACLRDLDAALARLNRLVDARLRRAGIAVPYR